GRERAIWAPDALLRAFLDATVDAFVRATRGAPALPSRRPSSWDERWREALTSARRDFAPEGFAERSVVDELTRWSEPALAPGTSCARASGWSLQARTASPSR
ncbi:hypothetical protein ACLEPN_44095, partial [Myxococcus sp. 1LA]